MARFITVEEWISASEPQRRAWASSGFLIRQEDRETFNAFLRNAAFEREFNLNSEKWAK